MKQFIEEIKYDANFIKGHRLQPGWYKILKVFLILGFLVGYVIIYGQRKTLIFGAVFFSLSFLVHLAYRINTKKFTQSWLDFVVIEENSEKLPKRIGIYYYIAVFTNLAIGLILSQLL